MNTEKTFPNAPNYPPRAVNQGPPPPPMGMPANMPNMPMNFAPGSMPFGAPYMGMGVAEHSEKKKEFARGVYVSGFEKTLTPAMLQEHFKIKPIAGLKMPLSKFNENKGFAFIYYGSPDDAAEVKRKLDYSVILRNKIRVTRTVIAENLSKMMFKLKDTDEKMDDVKSRFFNEQSLEREVERIIKPYFNDSIQVNKIVIPTSKKNSKETLNYARVFFYISDLRAASRIPKSHMPEVPENTQESQNEYEIVLGFIADKLNKEKDFSKYVKAEIYEYSKKNQSNILHFKGLEISKGEQPEALAEELKEFISKHLKQSSVKGCFARISDLGAWANVTFGNFAETQEAYELFKNQRIKFREKPLYANIRNVKDLRTVVISTARPGINEKEMNNFLKELSNNSARVDMNDEERGRKYDFLSFNIIEEKIFYIDSEDNSVSVNSEQEAKEYWRENNKVPRRVVVHFMNEIKEEEIHELISSIKSMKDWEKFFIEKDKKCPLRANHQKGHISNGAYVKHIDIRSGKKKNRGRGENKSNIPRGVRNDGAKGGKPGPTMPMTDLTQFKVGKGAAGVPKMNQMNKSNRPPINFTSKPPGAMGSGMAPSMGMGLPPQMGMMAGKGGVPPMGGMKPNQPPPMGMKPPMMGQMGQAPMMGQPQMGQQPPQMGQRPPQMGQNQPPPMGQPRMMGNPPPMGQQPPKQN